MRTFVSAVFVGLLILAASQAGDDSALKKELAVLAGKWNVLKIETGGGGGNESVDGSFLNFAKDGKTLEFTRGGKASKGTFSVNPTKMPKEITITPEGSDKVMLGIYKIEKNVITVCYSRKEGVGRPKDFAVTKDEKFILMTIERSK